MQKLEAEAAPNPNQYDFIVQSQESWRTLSRDILSRPQELPFLSRILDTSIKSVFSEYIDENRAPTLLAWSVLVDEPRKPQYWQTPRFPSEWNDETKVKYLCGIQQLNEWATDFTAQYWLSHLSKNQTLQAAAWTYALLQIEAQKAGYPLAFSLMNGVQESVKFQKFEDVIFQALFQHKFDNINTIIRYSGIDHCQTIDQLALSLGDRLPKNTITKKLLTLAHTKGEPLLKKLGKRILLSTMVGGVQRYPGVVEIILGQDVAKAAMLSGVIAPLNPLFGAEFALGFSTVFSPAWYALFHETVHDYQSDSRFNGLIPTKIQSQI